MTNALVLDSNAAIAVIHNEPGIIAKLDRTPTWYLPVIAYGELKFGAYASKRTAHNLERLRWLSELCTFLAVNEETADSYAQIKSELRTIGAPIPSNDCWIAALCRQHQYPLATLDAHFDKVNGITLLRW